LLSSRRDLLLFWLLPLRLFWLLPLLVFRRHPERSEWTPALAVAVAVALVVALAVALALAFASRVSQGFSLGIHSRHRSGL
jgi:multisubunit Na+/H+ antiporter MnhB subunit